MPIETPTVKATSQQGFTLAMLIPGITCLAILCSIALNSGYRWINERQAQNDRLVLVHMIEQARLQSLITQQAMVLCGSHTELDVAREAPSSCHAEWFNGFLLTPASWRQTSLIPPATYQLHSRVKLVSSIRSMLFYPDPAANVLSATFLFCTNHGIGYPIVVSRVGRIRLPRGKTFPECA